VAVKPASNTKSLISTYVSWQETTHATMDTLFSISAGSLADV
jgi:hypothetical protein